MDDAPVVLQPNSFVVGCSLALPMSRSASSLVLIRAMGWPGELQLRVDKRCVEWPAVTSVFDVHRYLKSVSQIYEASPATRQV
jgi:hypothetical protein